ncbi:MAG TPA: aminotransferase class IV [Gemmatimonadaceae bacterium]|nr:aminotransferase class IV [Gemmatimonadaceae bacterium]
MPTVYLNGDFLPFENAKLSVLDRGFVFGDGVYEVWRVVNGQLFEHERHDRRLRRGIHALELNVAERDVDGLADVASRLLRDNGLQQGEATFYVEITRGSAFPRTHQYPPTGTRPTVLGMVNRFEVPHALRASGAKAITEPDLRWLHCDIKTVQLLPNVMAKQKAHAAGAYEAIFVRDGTVTEGTHTSVLGVRNGELVTHPLSPLILPSVTREVVLEVAREQGVPVRERAFSERDMFDLDELFVAGTTSDVTAIVDVDGKRIGSGSPGPVARALYAGLQQRLYAESAVAQR